MCPILPCCDMACCAVLCAALQLLGVALVAVQGGLGEASALGLCSLHPNQLSLTAWSSGTGFAGVCTCMSRCSGPCQHTEVGPHDLLTDI
jgi:hypothetical protein